MNFTKILKEHEAEEERKKEIENDIKYQDVMNELEIEVFK